ncbi:MAG TPA: acyl-CoA carboxylase epsilon subunit [Jatrophihabitans sp.]|nr:acyl-CoA carboxylase epsilon subunit [Jatrophihabitans sp.]
MPPHIEIRGNASAEELAAVLAVVAHADGAGEPREPDAYRRWRQIRLRALRPTAPPAEHRAR